MHRLGTSLKLRPADYQNSADCGFLYGVLALRLCEPDGNISHHALPSWDDHIGYLRSGIYKSHYLATIGEHADLCIGHCYLDKHGNIGIFVARGFREHGVGRWMLNELISRHPPPLTANINPQNKASLRLFERAGFVLRDNTNPFQVTLRLEAVPERTAQPLEPA